MAFCLRCSRPLSDSGSIERGFGPVCWTKVQAEKGAEKAKEGNGGSGFYDGGDIVLRRVAGQAIANVPHAIVRHSPSGFEWGYGGSGPADLALNILLAVTGNKKVAEAHYQEFKWDFVARMPESGGVIRKDEIIQWLQHRGYKQK